MEITVTKERNYHIDPSDRFLMGRLSITIRDGGAAFVDSPESVIERLNALAEAELTKLIQADLDRLMSQAAVNIKSAKEAF